MLAKLLPPSVATENPDKCGLIQCLLLLPRRRRLLSGGTASSSKCSSLPLMFSQSCLSLCLPARLPGCLPACLPACLAAWLPPPPLTLSFRTGETTFIFLFSAIIQTNIHWTHARTLCISGIQHDVPIVLCRNADGRPKHPASRTSAVKNYNVIILYK